MGVVGSRSRSAGPFEGAGVLVDLEDLVDGPGLVAHLGRDGASVSLKSGRTLLYRRTGGRAWRRMTRALRAKALASWIRDAADIATARFVLRSVAS